jgi:hypothetical protein
VSAAPWPRPGLWQKSQGLVLLLFHTFRIVCAKCPPPVQYVANCYHQLFPVTGKYMRVWVGVWVAVLVAVAVGVLVRVGVFVRVAVKVAPLVTRLR